MKYRILIDQQAYDQYKEFDSLDVIDIGIMECIADFAFDRCEAIIDAPDGKYYWVSHTAIIKDFPRCGIKSKGGIRKRVKKLSDVGLIELYKGNQSLGRSYYKITDKFKLTRKGKSRKERLQNSDPCPQSSRVSTPEANDRTHSGQGGCPNEGNDYINNNTNLINNTHNSEVYKKSDVDFIVEEFNKLGKPFAKVTKLTPSRIKKAKDRLKEIGSKEEFISIIKSLPKYPFLCGKGSRGWVANFDFLIANPDNWVKISEGTYQTDESFSGGGSKFERKPKIEQYHNDPSLDDFDVNEKIAEYNRTHTDQIKM